MNPQDSERETESLCAASPIGSRTRGLLLAPVLPMQAPWVALLGAKADEEGKGCEVKWR